VASEPTQRSYRAPCPGCGAPVEFRSAQSAFAVCSFCRSTVARSGDTLSRIGRMSEVFEDYSPRQLMAAGRNDGRAFTLVGRLQYKGETGSWTEWIAAFDDGQEAVLAEDNGAFVFSQPLAAGRELPPAEHLRVGATTSIAGRTYNVASNLSVLLVSAQGELPKLPPLGQAFTMVELRGDDDVVSIDYGSQPPAVSRGRAVVLDQLQMTGLRAEAAKEEQGRQFNCPHCAAPVEVHLATTKSVTCGSCNSLIDVSQGIGGELRHAIQDEPVQPLISLGTSAHLQGLSWQVVGYQHRMGHEPGDADESFGWEEYLLYNQKFGFRFLVDAEDGWSLVKPTTGVPKHKKGSDIASYLGTNYKLQYSYEAETTYVAGEFYWPVERGQKTSNSDFAKGTSVLSMERTPKEVTWSSGSRIASDVVARAFKIEDKHALERHADAGPLSLLLGRHSVTIFIGLFLLAIALIIIYGDDGDGTGSGYSRSSSGSFGGFGGGSHK
jgi:ribosomal protein L37AE/L43A